MPMSKRSLGAIVVAVMAPALGGGAAWAAGQSGPANAGPTGASGTQAGRGEQGTTGSQGATGNQGAQPGHRNCPHDGNG
jgi:hypothetical protein